MTTNVQLFTVTWADTRIKKIVVEVLVDYDAAHDRVRELTERGFKAIAAEQGIDIFQ